MKQPVLRRWLGTGLAGFILVLGCNQAQRQCSTCSRGPSAPAMVMTPATTTETVVVAAPTPPPAPTLVAAAPTPPSPSVQETTVHKPVVQEKPAEPMGYAHPLTGGQEAGVRRRSFADITAHPSFGHAPDYSWLVGELQYVHIRNAWRVRYASVEEEDRYGGSVTLTETGSMADYKNGQIVRVEGQLADPESRDPSPTYRVRTLRVLTP